MKNNFNNGNNNFEYVGGRVNGMKQGFGIQTWKDGAVYKGNFMENKANGLGFFKHSDGDDYRGEFINDRACGYGVYKHSNGATYEGFWLDDCQNGIGEEFWNDDSHYRGNYFRGKKQGIGSYKWADGSRYEGEWFENCLHGYVIYLNIYVRVFITLMMTVCILDNGNITLCMAMENSIGKMEKDMQDTIFMIKKKDLESTTGLILIEFTSDFGKEESKTVSENILTLK